MRISNVPLLVLSTTTASLALAVRLRAGIPHHRDLVRRLDLKAPSHDDDVGFVQIGPGASITPTPTPPPPATPTQPSGVATKDSAAQWLSFATSGTSVPLPNEVNLVGSGGSVAGAGGGSGDGEGEVKSDVQGAQSITQQRPPPSTSTSTQSSGGLGPQTQEEVDRWIKAHNEARKAHGAGGLKWREDLSWGAKTNAERCQEGHTSVYPLQLQPMLSSSVLTEYHIDLLERISLRQVVTCPPNLQSAHGSRMLVCRRIPYLASGLTLISSVPRQI